MKTLYIECKMGAAGDMLMAALSELIEDRQAFLEKMNSLIPDTVSVSAEPAEKCGVTGTHIRVKIHGEEEECAQTSEHHDHGHDGHGHEHHDHEDGHHHHHHDHSHSGLQEIYAMIDGMDVSDKVKQDARAVYRIIAEAESRVHGKTMDQIHFHEVGTLDAVTDVVGNCLLMEQLGAEQIVVSPVHVGSGSVRCAHGLLPVPAPATALILRDIPIYGGRVQGELCTPTGAALLKYFADSFGTMPAMTVKKIGCGMGNRDFAEKPNCVRVFLGNAGAENTGIRKNDDSRLLQDEVTELAANIDDMTGEEIGFAMDVLLEAGALDVYCEHITMKKSRPAVKLVCMCRPEHKDIFAQLMLKHTSTIGVREYGCRRVIMQRSSEKRETPWGSVDVKICEGGGIRREKAESDQLCEIARRTGLSLKEIKKEVYK